MAVSQSLTLTESSYSVTNNSSQVRILWTSTQSGESHNDNTRTAYYYVSVNGGAETTYSVTYTLPANTTKTIVDSTITVNHNTDGSGTITVRTYMDTRISAGVVEKTQTLTLTNIPRKATITNAPNFNQTQSPTITYNNPLGNSATSLQACISTNLSTGNIAAFRDISKTGTSYTFTLTSSEIANLQTLTATSTSATVYFMVRTTYGSNTQFSALPKTFTVTQTSSTEPSLSPTVVDTYNKTLALTGNANILVAGISKPQVTINAAAQFGSTLTSKGVSSDGSSRTTDGEMPAPVSGQYKFTATDSRGFTKNVTVTKTIKNYFKPTYNWNMGSISTAGAVSFTVTGTFWNASFGATTNTLSVGYAYKLASSSETLVIHDVTPTISGNNYSFTVSLTGLDYTQTYFFAIKISDSIYFNLYNQNTSGKPIFEIQKNAVNFNVPVTHNRDLYFGNESFHDIRFGTYTGTYPHEMMIRTYAENQPVAIAIHDRKNSRNVLNYRDYDDKIEIGDSYSSTTIKGKATVAKQLNYPTVNRTAIPDGADLNTYLASGHYNCAGTSTAQGLLHCPTTRAFIMDVYESNGSVISTAASPRPYLIQHIIDLYGEEWTRYTITASTTVTWSNWAKYIKNNGTITLGNGTDTVNVNGSRLGKITSSYPSNVTVPTATWTNLAQITLTTGYWVVVCNHGWTTSFSQGAYDELRTTGSLAFNRGTGIGGGGMSLCYITTPSSSTTYTYRTYQASGVDKIASAIKMQAICIGWNG